MRKPVTSVERPVHIRSQIAGRILQCEAVEIFRARHRERQAEALRQPPRETDMVGMIVRHDHRGEALSRHWSGQDRIPCRPAGVGAEAGVEHRPTVVVLNQIDVHMIEAIRQRQAQPLHTRRNLDELAWLRGLRVGELQCGGGWGLVHCGSLARRGDHGEIACHDRWLRCDAAAERRTSDVCSAPHVGRSKAISASHKLSFPRMPHPVMALV